MFHIFDGPCYMKKEIHENHDCNHIFHVFLIFRVAGSIIFRVAGSIKSMQHVYSLDEELNFSSNDYSRLKFE